MFRNIEGACWEFCRASAGERCEGGCRSVDDIIMMFCYVSNVLDVAFVGEEELKR